MPKTKRKPPGLENASQDEKKPRQENSDVELTQEAIETFFHFHFSRDPEKRIDINEENDDGETFLIVALKRANLKFASALLDLGAGPNKGIGDDYHTNKERIGKSPLQMLLAMISISTSLEHEGSPSKLDGFILLLEKMLQKNANPNLKLEGQAGDYPINSLFCEYSSTEFFKRKKSEVLTLLEQYGVDLSKLSPEHHKAYQELVDYRASLHSSTPSSSSASCSSSSSSVNFWPSVPHADEKALAQIRETCDFLISDLGLSISKNKRKSYLKELAFYEKLAQHAKLNPKDRKDLNVLLENLQADQVAQLSLMPKLSSDT